MRAEALAVRPIGNTGVNATPICFGTSSLGDAPNTYRYSVDEERARATLHALFDSPVNFLDTSRNYGLGRSEQRIGAVILERGGLPPDFVISTKLDRDEETDAFDAARARRSLESSLTALGVDKVDILHLHDPEFAADLNEITAPGGAIAELIRMKEEGLTKAIGLAMGRIDLMAQLLEQYPFDVVITHNRFSLLNQNAEKILDQARASGISVLNAAPYSGGILAKGVAEVPRIAYRDAAPDVLERARAVEQICRRHEVSVGAAALQFSMREARIASTIIGVTRPERIQETLTWATAHIPEILWTEIEALGKVNHDPEAGHEFIRG